MGDKITTTTISTFLTSETVSYKDIIAPSLVILAKSCIPSFLKFSVLEGMVSGPTDGGTSKPFCFTHFLSGLKGVLVSEMGRRQAFKFFFNAKIVSLMVS